RARDRVSPVTSRSVFVRAPIGKSPRSPLTEPLSAGPLPATRSIPAPALLPIPVSARNPDPPLAATGLALPLNRSALAVCTPRCRDGPVRAPDGSCVRRHVNVASLPDWEQTHKRLLKN